MAESAREVAVRFLIEVDRGSHADDLSRLKSFRALSPRDRALAKSLVYGVLRNRGCLDFYVKRLSRHPLSRLDREVLWILRCGLFELDQLRTPQRAVVHTSVELCRRMRVASAAPFVNALLRGFLRRRPDIPSGLDSESLSIAHSHPSWLVERYLRRYGLEKARALMERNNTEAEHALWINPFKTDFGDFCDRLREDEIDYRVYSGLEHCLIAPASLVRHPLYRQGHAFFMDIASQQVAAVPPLEGVRRIADTCAAPGGKSFLLAARSQGKAEIFCSDSSFARLSAMGRRTRLYGIPGLHLVLSDWSRAVPYRIQFDLVLVDAPCSGLGTLRSRPDIRWKVSESDLPRHAKRQGEILERAFATVRPGGRMLYSTCSTEPEENDDVVGAFLKSHPPARIEQQGATFPEQHPGDCFYWVLIRHA